MTCCRPNANRRRRGGERDEGRGGGGGAEKFSEFRSVLQLIFQTTSSLISLIATFSALRSAAKFFLFCRGESRLDYPLPRDLLAQTLAGFTL